MRLDKYLQVARLVKKREFTRELCEANRVAVNGRQAKPSKQVAPGDVIRILSWRRDLTLRIRECPPGNISRKDAGSLYEILDDRPVAEEPLLPTD